MPLLIKIEKHYYLKTTESEHGDIPVSQRNRGQSWGYRAQLSPVAMSNGSQGIAS